MGVGVLKTAVRDLFPFLNCRAFATHSPGLGGWDWGLAVRIAEMSV